MAVNQSNYLKYSNLLCSQQSIGDVQSPEGILVEKMGLGEVEPEDTAGLCSTQAPRLSSPRTGKVSEGTSNTMGSSAKNQGHFKSQH